jgi:MarR-like DNA-binding transcriptional regulator SgrR of sgrS sRNA
VRLGQSVDGLGRPEANRFEKTPLPCFQEHHYTVAEIAQIWNVSEDLIRKLFQAEPGVLVIPSDRARAKRARYHTLRIPESVVERVHRKLSNCDLTLRRARVYASSKSGAPVAETTNAP